MGRLEGKIAVITGATGGIGAASAALFVREGARVVLVDRDESQLRELSDRLGRDQTAFAAADVSSVEDTQRYVQLAVSRFGGIDVMFANAGIEGKVASIVDFDVGVFDRVLAVNLRGVLLAMKHAAPAIAKRGGGSIVCTSSVAGLKGFKGLGAYVASKHAVIGLCKTAAIDLAPMRIRVNTINPGPIENRMMRSIEEQIDPAHASDVKRGFEGIVPLARYGTNEEVARLAVFLASDESAYCNGASFLVDGGLMAQ